MKTYGSVVNVLSFPELIDTSTFPLNIEGLQLNVKTLKKEEALLSFKRQRASDRFEVDNMTSGTEGEAVEQILESISLAESAIREIEDGKTFSKFSCSILVKGKTKEEVLRRKQELITALSEAKIFATISLNQAEDYINNFLKLQPKDLIHMAEIKFPLSFQLNNGSTIGDAGSKYFSMQIGKDI